MADDTTSKRMIVIKSCGGFFDPGGEGCPIVGEEGCPFDGKSKDEFRKMRGSDKIYRGCRLPKVETTEGKDDDRTDRDEG